MLIPSLLVFLTKWPVLSVCQCVSVSVSYSPSWDWRPSSAFIKYHGCPKLVLFGILSLFCTFFLGYLYTSFEWSWLYIDISRNFCETHPVYQLSAWYSFFYILKASPVPTILDHSEFCWVPFPQDPSSPHSCSQVSMKCVSSLCSSCCQPILYYQSLSFPLTTVVVIWLISYLLLCQHCLRKIKKKKTCIRLEFALAFRCSP